MRRVLFVSLTGVIVGGCAGPDMIRPPTEPLTFASADVAPRSVSTTSKVNATLGLLDDAIDRLIPALGPAGVALGAPLRQLRDSGQLEAQLIDATQRQLTALSANLPPEDAADADALRLTLDALRSTTSK